MTWSPQPPGISAVAIVWDEIDRKVQSELPKNKQKLFTHLHAVTWESLPPIHLNELLERMLKILQ